MNDKRFHISPDGVPRACNPLKTGVCRYGSDVPHFSTEEDARIAYEAAQKGTLLPSFLRKTAIQNNEVFNFAGVELDSQIWIYNPSATNWPENIQMTSDGFNYCIDQSGSYSSLEIMVRKNGGWEDDLRQSYDSVAEAVGSAMAHVTNVVKKKIQESAERRGVQADVSENAIIEHLRKQKLRYDRLSAK